MQLHRKAIQMTNMKRAKVGMESIVQEALINRKVNRRVNLGPSGYRAWLRLRRTFALGATLTGVGERSVRVWWMCIRSKIETI